MSVFFLGVSMYCEFRCLQKPGGSLTSRVIGDCEQPWVVARKRTGFSARATSALSCGAVFPRLEALPFKGHISTLAHCGPSFRHMTLLKDITAN